jgi:hypothetical protein
MSPRHGLLRLGVGLLLAVAGTLALSASAFAQTEAASVQALGARCTTIIGSAGLVVPGTGDVDVVDHLTTGGHGVPLFSVTVDTDTLPEEPPLVQLTKLEHAACGKTGIEAAFSADGLATVSGEPGYGIALTFRKYRGTDYLTLNLAKNGHKVLTLTNVELVPCPFELIL